MILCNVAPSGSPTGIQVTGLSPTEIRVTVTPIPVGTENGIILYYYVCFREPNDESCTKDANIDANLDTLTVIKDGLNPNTEYRIRVRAYNSEGGGPYGDEVTLMTCMLSIRTSNKTMILFIRVFVFYSCFAVCF